MIRRFLSISGLLLAASAITACGGVDSDESQPVVTEPDQGLFTALFNPSAAQVPFPNDIFFSGTTDGTLNIPAAETNSALGALNELDGYSTTASIYVDTTDSINADSLVYGQTVFLINTNTMMPVVATVGRADFANGTATIEIVPAAPLAPATTYVGLVTQNVVSTNGDNLMPDEAFASFQALYAAGVTPATVDTGDATTDALYGAIYPTFQVADGATIGAANLAVSWSFKTQSIGASLSALSAAAEAQASSFVPVLRDPQDPGQGIRTAGELLLPASDLTGDGQPDIGTNADVYIGMIEMPYYYDDPLTGNWVPNGDVCAQVVAAVDELTAQPASTTSACPLPAEAALHKLPVLLTVPNATSMSGGAIAGVTMFQHGITGNRSNMLALAGAMADAGQALLAIDLPLHGVTDTSSPLYAANLPFENVTEQTFDLDVDGDGEIDASGSHFINLASLLTTRDSLRQAAANLLHLEASISSMDYNAALDMGATPNDFAGLPVNFVGQSLGSITGTDFLAHSDETNAAVLSVPGGVLTQLLTDSPTFAPQINAGLQEANPALVPGSRFYEEFLRNAQTVVDGGDPINYAATANAAHPVLMHEVVGGAGSPSDQVVPNSATDALAAAMGLSQVGPGLVTGTEVDALVRFTAGGHSSLLDPTASQAATEEMQTQAASFVASGGMQLPVGSVDPSVIEQP